MPESTASNADVTTSLESTPAATEAASPAVATAAAADWKAGFPDDLKALVEAKGWDSPLDPVISYKQIEEWQGRAPLRIPGEGAKPEEWGKVYDALGRPKTADEYGIADRPSDFPAEIPYSEDVARYFSTVFHEFGLTKQQAQGIAGKYNAKQREMFETYVAQRTAESQKADAELHAEWGPKFEPNKLAALRAASQYAPGLDIANDPALLRVFERIYRDVGDDTSVNPRDGGGGPVRESPSEKIDAMLADDEFRAALYGRKGEAAKKVADKRWNDVLAAQAAETATGNP